MNNSWAGASKNMREEVTLRLCMLNDIERVLEV